MASEVRSEEEKDGKEERGGNDRLPAPKKYVGTELLDQQPQTFTSEAGDIEREENEEQEENDRSATPATGSSLLSNRSPQTNVNVRDVDCEYDGVEEEEEKEKEAGLGEHSLDEDVENKDEESEENDCEPSAFNMAVKEAGQLHRHCHICILKHPS